jgi:hypothetical protein
MRTISVTLRSFAAASQILGLVATLVAPALAQDATATPTPKPLSGDYYVGPGLDAATDSTKAPADHFFVTLTGDPAKAMYDAMKTKTVMDQCVGRIAKWAKGLVCYGPETSDGSKADPAYQCEFSINLKSSKLELGEDC